MISITFTGLVSGVVHQLFVSAETDITSQIPLSDLESRSVVISYQLPNTDSVTELIIGVTASATGVAILAVIILIVALSIGVQCYKKKKQKRMKTKSMELQADVLPEPFQSNPSYGPIWNTPVNREGAYDYDTRYERIDNVCEQAEVWNQTQKLEEVRGDLVSSMEAETGVTVQPNVAYGPLAESETVLPSHLQLNPPDRPEHAAQQQANNTEDPYDTIT